MGILCRFTSIGPFLTNQVGVSGGRPGPHRRGKVSCFPGCQFPGGKRDPGRGSGGPILTGNGDRTRSGIQVSSLSCIAQPLLSWFGARKGLIQEEASQARPRCPAQPPAVPGGLERWRHRAALPGGRARAPRRPHGWGRGGRAPTLTLGAGPAAVTRGGGAARLRGPAGDSFKRRAACAAAGPLAGSGSGAASFRSWAAGPAAGRPGKEGAPSPRPGSAARGQARRDGAPSGAPCLPASLRKSACAADAAAPAPRPPAPASCPAPSAPRPRPSRSPLPRPRASSGRDSRPGRARWGSSGGTCRWRSRRAQETPPARETWTETMTGCGTGRGGGVLNGDSP